MELPACVCDRTCSCFSATAESILPTFDTRSVTKKTNSTLPDISLRPHCFREDVRSETPGITRGLRSFYRLVLSNFRRNALYACITPGRNEALCLFCSESFYMSPQGFRSATWSPTIPLRKIAFASLCLKFPQLALQAQFPSSALINCWAVRPETPPCRNSNWSARRSSSSSASVMPWRSASASTIS